MEKDKSDFKPSRATLIERRPYTTEDDLSSCECNPCGGMEGTYEARPAPERSDQSSSKED